MAVLSKEDLLRRRWPVQPEPVEIPGRGTAYVRTLSGDRRDYWDLFRTQSRDPETGRLMLATRHFRATLVGLALCDAEGAFFCDPYADGWPVEVEAIGEDDGDVVDLLYDAAERVSKLTAAAKEEARKNSNAAPSDGSG